MEAANARLNDAEGWLETSPGGRASGVGSAADTSDEPGPSPVGMVVADQEEFRSLPGTIALARSFRAQAFGDIAGTVEYARSAAIVLRRTLAAWGNPFVFRAQAMGSGLSGAWGPGSDALMLAGGTIRQGARALFAARCPIRWSCRVPWTAGGAIRIDGVPRCKCR